MIYEFPSTQAVTARLLRRFTADSDDAENYLRLGDELTVDPQSHPRSGDLVIIRRGKGYAIRRYDPLCASLLVGRIVAIARRL